MKTIGLIGGMSWESSIEYYRIINEKTKEALGGLHSAKCLMVSLDFAEVEILQREGRWEEADQMMLESAKRLEKGGADCIVICTNTMHRSAGVIQANLSIPLLHIADATAKQALQSGIHKIGLLGTRFTMEEDFYKGRLVEKFGLEVIIPEPEECEIIHRVIYDELVLGKILPGSRDQYAGIIQRMVDRGARGVILGCTEIGLLIHDQDCLVPLFDTTRIHAEAAVDFALR